MTAPPKRFSAESMLPWHAARLITPRVGNGRPAPQQASARSDPVNHCAMAATKMIVARNGRREQAVWQSRVRASLDRLALWPCAGSGFYRSVAATTQGCHCVCAGTLVALSARHRECLAMARVAGVGIAPANTIGWRSSAGRRFAGWRCHCKQSASADALIEGSGVQ